MKEIKHLSVHQWLRSATPDSQQPTSPIGFLCLKLPPPPCAVLLVYTIFYVYIYTFVHLANRSGGSCLFSKGGVNEEKRLCAQMTKISGFYVNLARSRFLYRNPKLDRTLEALKYSIFWGGDPYVLSVSIGGIGFQDQH